jgi:hypothetical protein
VAEIGGCKAQGNSATAEGRHLEPTLCFKGIENYNYQRLGTQTVLIGLSDDTDRNR